MIGPQSMAFRFGISFLLVGLFATVPVGRSLGQEDSALANTIKQLMTEQTKCWNGGDIEGFMETYWKSEMLTFSSGGKTARGWKTTLERYKKGYDTREKMGVLKFSEIEVVSLGEKAALVLGRWHLARKKVGDVGGNFSLVWRKFDDGWKIVHDHTSTEDDESSDDGAESADETKDGDEGYCR